MTVIYVCHTYSTPNPSRHIVPQPPLRITVRVIATDFLDQHNYVSAHKILSLGNTSPAMADSFKEANLSALVGPMFKIAMGLFCCQAA